MATTPEPQPEAPIPASDPPLSAAGRRRTAVSYRRLAVAIAVICAVAGGLRLWLDRSLEPIDWAFLKPEGGHVMYLPTPQDVVVSMLDLAEVSRDDLVYDLGCGDGRILVTAARTRGCRCRGFDISPHRVRDSLENVRRHGVSPLVSVEQRDIFTLDLSEADVVFLYLLPELNVRLIPQLQRLKPGARVVSHNFDMAGVTPDRVLRVESREDHREHLLYLWVAPLRVGGDPAGAPPASGDGGG